MTFIGKVANGTIVLPPDAHLPEGAEVEVHTLVAKAKPKTGRELAAIWASKSRLPVDEAERLARDVEAGRTTMNRTPSSPAWE